jgi:hypothetical protein
MPNFCIRESPLTPRESSPQKSQFRISGEIIAGYKAIKQTLLFFLREFFKINQPYRLFLGFSLPKAAELSGGAGQFCCHSLHCSQNGLGFVNNAG